MSTVDSCADARFTGSRRGDVASTQSRHLPFGSFDCMGAGASANQPAERLRADSIFAVSTQRPNRFISRSSSCGSGSPYDDDVLDDEGWLLAQRAQELQVPVKCNA